MASKCSEKKSRSRKKGLHTNIVAQMEFYFSDSNLDKDRFLSDLINVNPEVEIDIFLKFNKIRSLTTDKAEIIKALDTKSALLKLTDDKKRVYRVTERQPKENADDCTIYVEGFGPEMTIDRLKDTFVHFGKIDYISLPKYSTGDKLNKGFAFVEFHLPESVAKAIEKFTATKRLISKDEPPSKLSSVRSYVPEPEKNGNSKKKRKLIDETTVKVVVEGGVKPKNDKNDEKLASQSIENVKETGETICATPQEEKLVPPTPQLGKEDQLVVQSEQEEDIADPLDGAKDQLVNENEQEAQPDTGDDKKVLPQEGPQKPVVQPTKKSKKEMLRITTKKDWKYLRNKYLNEQREQGKVVKNMLRETKDSKKVKENKLENQEADSVDLEKSEMPKREIYGYIVKFVLNEGCEDKKTFQKSTKALDKAILYVEIGTTEKVGYIRFSKKDNAKIFCANDLKTFADGKFGSLELLCKYERIAHLTKVKESLVERLKKRKRKRGREKLKKKMEAVQLAPNSHVRFEDEPVTT